MISETAMTPESAQTLHLVFGGELKSLSNVNFADPQALHVVGIYADYAHAYSAWRDAAQQTVDNAHMRYFIVPLHELLDPSKGKD